MQDAGTHGDGMEFYPVGALVLLTPEERDSNCHGRVGSHFWPELLVVISSTDAYIENSQSLPDCVTRKSFIATTQTRLDVMNTDDAMPRLNSIDNRILSKSQTRVCRGSGAHPP